MSIRYEYQAPLTHRTHGPGLVLLLSDRYVESRSHLDPPPAQKWAEEGFAVFSVIGEPEDIVDGWSEVYIAYQVRLGGKGEVEKDKNFGMIIYEPELAGMVKLLDFSKIACLVLYIDAGQTVVLGDRTPPVLQHACSWRPAHAAPAQPPVQDADNRPPGSEPSSQVTTYTYDLPASPDPTARSFVHPHSPSYNHTAAALAHTRTLNFLRKHIGGPLFDIEAIWEAHTRFEFEGRDVEGTMGTMVAEPYVNHIPTLTGGIGRKALTSFYTHHFIHSNPDSTRLELVSRTIGPDRVVDEFNFEFTHDREIDWMLPGVPPTGKHVRVPFVAVVNVRGDKLYHEHIYWDQASVLVQIGLLPERLAFPGTANAIRLPVYGVEQAEKMLDPGSRASNLLIN